MQCSVRNCLNNESTTRDSHGITFHKFSLNSGLRNVWAEVLGMADDPKALKIICSDHFRSEDIYITQRGQHRIREGAIPVVVQVCRICLATDLKMYNIRDRGLQQIYADVCGIFMEEDRLKDKLPEKLCWECTARLLAGSRFRNKAIRTHQLLTQLLHTTAYITLRDINSINRIENDLESNLAHHYNKPNECHLLIKEAFSMQPEVDDIEKGEKYNFDDNFEVEKDNFEEEKDNFEEEKDNFEEEKDNIEEEKDNFEEEKDNFEEEKDNFEDEKDNFEDEKDNYEDEKDNYEEEKDNFEEEKDNLGKVKDCVEEVRICLEEEDNLEELSCAGEVINEINNDLLYEYDEYVYDDDAEQNKDVNEENDELIQHTVSKRNKRKANIKDHNYDDDEQSALNDSDENSVKDKVSNVKKRKLNKKVIKTEKVVKKKPEEKSRATKEKHEMSDVNRDGLNESFFTITTLNKEEQIAEARRRRRSAAWYNNAPYRCAVCGVGFRERSTYDAHVVRHTEQAGALECPICAKRQKTARALRNHITGLHSRRYSCNKCPFVTNGRNTALNHQRWHEDITYQCPHCPCAFKIRSTYFSHLRLKHRADFVCELCGHTFLSKSGVAAHKNLHHLTDDKTPLEGPCCEACDMQFASEEAYDRHFKFASRHSDKNDLNLIRNDPTQSKRSMNKCSQKKVGRGPVIFSRDGTDKDGTSDNDESVTCEQCGKECPSYIKYAHHFMRAHPDKTRTHYSGKYQHLMCEQCGRMFQSTYSLREHMWTHTGKTPYQCDYCSKKFDQKSTLIDHLKKTNHSGDNFQCRDCDKRFSHKCMLLEHCKTHKEERRYACSICGKEFNNHFNRHKHMWTHAAQKPIKCVACNKTFSTASDQKTHFEHAHLKKPWPKKNKTPSGKRRTKRKEPIEN